MPIIKNRTQASFTVISNSILRDSELSMKERGMLCTLLSFPDNWSFSVNGLSKIVPDGRDSIANSLKKLVSAGYIQYNRIRNSEGKYDVEIELSDIRGTFICCDDAKEKDNRNGFSVTVNTDTVKTVTDNPIQYNTNIFSNDIYNIEYNQFNSFHIQKIKNKIKGQIEYTSFNTAEQSWIDELIEVIISEIYLSNEKQININNEKKQIKKPKEYLIDTINTKMTKGVILNYLDNMRKSSKKIKSNPKQYILKTIYQLCLTGATQYISGGTTYEHI